MIFFIYIISTNCITFYNKKLVTHNNDYCSIFLFTIFYYLQNVLLNKLEYITKCNSTCLFYNFFESISKKCFYPFVFTNTYSIQKSCGYPLRKATKMLYDSDVIHCHVCIRMMYT